MYVSWSYLSFSYICNILIKSGFFQFVDHSSCIFLIVILIFVIIYVTKTYMNYKFTVTVPSSKFPSVELLPVELPFLMCFIMREVNVIGIEMFHSIGFSTPRYLFMYTYLELHSVYILLSSSGFISLSTTVYNNNYIYMKWG